MHSRSRWRLRDGAQYIEEDVPPFFCDAMAEEYAAYEEEEQNSRAAASTFWMNFLNEKRMGKRKQKSDGVRCMPALTAR